MLEDKDDIRLLYQSISELATELGQNQFETKLLAKYLYKWI
ncbi:hypothetical protein [Staphylococcus caeli]